MSYLAALLPAAPMATVTTAAGTATMTGAAIGASSLYAALPAILSGVGTGMQTLGVLGMGQSARAAGEYNAALAEQNARFTRQKAKEDYRRFNISSRKQQGRMQALYAKAGVTLEGSPGDVLDEAMDIAALDALSILHSGERQALGYKGEAEMERYAGKAAERQSYYKAAGTLLSGADDMYSKWPKKTKTGVV